MVVRREQNQVGTSPSKLYANTERTADFLLGSNLTYINPQAREIGLQLLG
jgi:hypothetical protein